MDQLPSSPADPDFDAEVEIRRSLIELETIYATAPIGLAVLDTKLRYLRINTRLAAMNGASPEAHIGRTVREMIPDLADKLEPLFRQVIDTGQAIPNLEITGETPAQPGIDRIWREHLHPLKTPNGLVIGVNIVAEDITERRLLENEIRALNTDLEARVAARTAEAAAANAAKSDFLAQMSHELRTPLNVILGLTQLLEQGALNALQQHQLERIREAGEGLLAILSDILDVSKIEARRLGIEHTPIALDTLLGRLESLQGRDAHAKGLSLHIDRPVLPDGALLGDGRRLEQVLNNLIGNAIKFTNAGGIELRIQARDIEADNLRLYFEVRDTGIGIDPQALAGLFHPFVQANTSIAHRYGGSGLGLAISKQLVELMGGRIGAVSRPGAGSTFWFDLPFERLETEANAVLPSIPTAVESADTALAGWPILVVDDSAMNLDVVAQTLEAAGAVVTTANDGDQALQRLRSEPQAYRAVLMDIRMPVMDGLTATRRIRQELGLHDLPIIALSAGVLPHECRAALDAGMDAVLNKPVRLEQIIATLLHSTEPEKNAAALRPESPGPSSEYDARFPRLPGSDGAQAAEILGGNRTMFLNLLALLTTEDGDLVERVQGDLAQGRRQDAAVRLHNLKSHAGSLGALNIVALAGRLEAAIDRGECELEPDLQRLDRQLRDLIEAGAPYLTP